jgi:hypothetical protein
MLYFDDVRGKTLSSVSSKQRLSKNKEIWHNMVNLNWILRKTAMLLLSYQITEAKLKTMMKKGGILFKIILLFS